MFYQTELDFLMSLLKNYHIPALLLDPRDITPGSIDEGLRQVLQLEDGHQNMQHFLTEILPPKQLCKVRDPFFCCYYFLRLPDTADPTVLSVGPFLEQNVMPSLLMEMLTKYNLPMTHLAMAQKYFSHIPMVTGGLSLHTLLYTFAEKIWGTDGAFTTRVYEHGFSAELPVPVSAPTPTEQENALLSMEMLEKRYEQENQLIQAVSQGHSYKTEMLISALHTFQLEQRSSDVLRNTKNYCIILNTLLRKAAENGSVHPLYIDQISSSFAHRIEDAASVDVCRKLMPEMIRKYTLLVRNHSMKGYSLLIQKVIIHIDFDLTADLSLNAIASLMNVNPSYLSTQFKKETGSTLTDYVTHRRIEHALLLLNSSSLQIQTIAQRCGIADVNYFTKLFKKYINKTPREYRAEIISR